MKSNFRKVALLLAVVALLCSALFANTAIVSAAGDPTLVVASAEGKAGDEVAVQIKLENNPGLVSAVIKVGYDADALELVSVEAEGAYADARPTINTKKNPFVVNFCDAIADEDYTEELFATATFKIKDTAAAGVYNFTLKCDYEGDFYKLNWDVIEFVEQVGAITVIGDAPACEHAYDDKYDVDCNLCGEIREVPGPVAPEVPENAILNDNFDNGEKQGLSSGSDLSVVNNGLKFQCTKDWANIYKYVNFTVFFGGGFHIIFS